MSGYGSGMSRAVVRNRIATVVAAGALLVGGCSTTGTGTDNEASSQASAAASSSSSAANAGVSDRVATLLDEAKQAYDSPKRVSNAGNTDKTVDNMTIVEEKLLAAAQLAPYRADLLFSAASARIAQKNVAGAIDLYNRVLGFAPDDDDAHTYLAVWKRFLGDEAGSAAAVNRLNVIAPERVREVQALFAEVDRSVATPITDAPPAVAPANSAIVVLGYALKPDGTMDEPLISRLEKTVEVARAIPDAPIVVTGGVEKAGNTEGALMKNWLVEHGVDGARITDENFAKTTVENALYSTYIVAAKRATHAVVVSSASHVRRGVVDVALAARENLPDNFTVSAVAALDKPLDQLAKPSEDEMRSIYRDALSTIGLWSYRSAPLLTR